MTTILSLIFHYFVPKVGTQSVVQQAGWRGETVDIIC